MELSKITSVQNPLQIEEILAHILHYLELEDTLSCRSVCKFWNRVATSSLKDRLEDEVSISFAPHENNKCTFALLYLDMISKSELIFQNAVFDDFPMGIVNNQPITQLWRKIGHNLTSLNLNYDSKSKEITSKHLADILINRSPFLTELKIRDLPDIVMRSPLFEEKAKRNLELELQKIHLVSHWGKYNTHRSYSVEFLDDLFSASRNLQSLILESDYDSEAANSRILRCLANKGNLTHLTEISIDNIDGGGMTVLVNGLRNCQLKSVILKCVKEPANALLTEFLNSHANTLENLTIVINDWSEENKIIFPVLKNLAKLEFGGAYDISLQKIPIPFDSIDYRNLFPKLKTLKILDAFVTRFQSLYENSFVVKEEFVFRALNLDIIFPPSCTPCLTVKNLHLPGMIPGTILDRIGDMFPNVMNLSLDAQDWNDLDKIWTNWPQIRTLGVCLNMTKFILRDKHGSRQLRSLDSIFTGIPHSNLKKLMTKIEKHGLDTISKEKLQTFQTHPSILNLKNLSHLVLHDGPSFGNWSNWNPPSKITDLTCMFGFMQMESLTHLWINYGIHEITTSTRSALEEKIGDEVKELMILPDEFMKLFQFSY